MYFRQLDPETYVNAYNVDLQILFPWEGVATPPYGAVWAILAPGETTKAHSHQDCEAFFFARGQGRMTLAGESFDVKEGTVTYHRPFDEHVLTNTSDNEDLLFLSVYWEDRGLWKRLQAEAEAAGKTVEIHDHDHGHHGSEGSVEGSAPLQTAASRRRPVRTLVVAAPPTPNGDLHVGHLSGPYVAGDTHTRYLRMRGVQAHFGAGTDDNSIFVKSLAASLGKTPQQTADDMAEEIAATLSAAGVERAVAMHPNASPHHRKIVQDFFLRLVETGRLVEKEAPLPWCSDCEQWLFESYIKGRCSGCGVVLNGGNTCEECAWVHEPATILDAACSTCGKAAELRDVRRFFFDIGAYAAELAEFVRNTPMAPRLQAFCEAAIERGLPEIGVTYPVDWGIPVPVEGWEDQRIWVWFEMGPRYLSYAQGLAEELGVEGGWSSYWTTEDSEFVQFFGFDNSFCYSLMIPALYMAHGGLNLPSAFVVNEFYRLDGLKFSTSRNHRIMGRELAGEASVDAVRYFLAWDRPEREETSFSREAFRSTARRVLVDGVEDWLRLFAQRLRTAYEGKVPATGDWRPHHRRFVLRLEELAAEAADAYEADTFSLQRVAQVIDALVREGRRFGAGEVHWSKVAARGEERRTGAALEALAVKTLAMISAPLMPGFSADLWTRLGLGSKGPESWDDALDWVPSGTEIGDFERRFFSGI